MLNVFMTFLQASGLPMSIIIIGIGQADFEGMLFETFIIYFYGIITYIHSVKCC